MPLPVLHANGRHFTPRLMYQYAGLFIYVPSRYIFAEAICDREILAEAIRAMLHMCRRNLRSSQVDSYSFGVVLWELITREHSERGNWRPVRVPEECPAEVDALLKVRPSAAVQSSW